MWHRRIGFTVEIKLLSIDIYPLVYSVSIKSTQYFVTNLWSVHGDHWFTVSPVPSDKMAYTSGLQPVPLQLLQKLTSHSCTRVLNAK